MIMSRLLLAIGLLLGVALFPTPAWVQDLTSLKSESIDLPLSNQQFEGSGADAINNNCLACHSADMVLNQPALPKATWEAEVRKMIDVYKAPITEGDVAAIVAYLARTKGTD
jgi:mono/diheme cytochrome c family protein